MTSSRGKLQNYPPRHILREAGLLLLITLVLATLAWALRPPRLPLRADIALYELDLGFPVVDAADETLVADGTSGMLPADDTFVADDTVDTDDAPGTDDTVDTDDTPGIDDAPAPGDADEEERD